VHPARQFRLAAALLALLIVAATTPLVARQGRAGGRTPRQSGLVTRREPGKRPPLATVAGWTTTLPAPSRHAPAFDEAAAYIGLETNQVVALSLADGKIRWTIELGALNGLAAGDGLVFVPAGDGIEARDAETGSARWHAPLDAPLSAPLVWQNGWLFAATAKGSLTMLRAASGEPIWHRSFGSAVRVPAALTGERLYVLADNGHVAALQLGTGVTIWDRALGARPTTLLPLDDRLFVGADDKFFYCLSAKDGGRKWRWRTGGSFVGTPVADDGRVYFLSLDGVLRALNRGGGSQEWQTVIPFRPVAGPYLSAQLLIVCGFADVRAYQAAGGQPAGAAEIPGELAAAPHFLSIVPEDAASPFVILTREAQALLLVPQGPPLPSKTFPPKSEELLAPGILIEEIWDEEGSGLTALALSLTR
jgi:outer membrane protein assembly factor BamB